MQRETCATCRFAESTGTQYRECRRNAPIAKDETNQLGGVIQAHWPMVKDSHWCGEHATVIDARATPENRVIWQVSYDGGALWLDWARKPNAETDASLAMAKVRCVAVVVD